MITALRDERSTSVHHESCQLEHWLDLLENNCPGATKQYHDYNMKLHNSTLAALHVRQRQLNEQNIDFTQFENEYKNNPIDALEHLFLHPVAKSDSRILQAKIDDNEITLLELHRYHAEEPTYRLLRLLL